MTTLQEEKKHIGSPDDRFVSQTVMEASPDDIAAIESRAKEDGISPIFLTKVMVLNDAIQKCGLGRYQWQMFVSAGFGWYADNIWLQAIAIVMPYVQAEEHFPSDKYIRLATLFLFTGLICGATFWGMTADIVGRRLSWNLTITLSAIFGLAAGAAPNFVALCALLTLVGFGVGGNLPVDGALFLEFLPGQYQYLLTLLSLWWSVGQVVASLIAWGFLVKYSCPEDTFYTAACNTSNNQGWRYTYYTLGGHMLVIAIIRVFVLPMDESPKFLVSIGQDQAAIDVIHNIARANKVDIQLTVEDLKAAARPFMDGKDENTGFVTKFSTWELVKHSMDEMSKGHVKALFATKRLAYSTTLIILIYGMVGLAFPLFNAFLGSYLSSRLAESGTTESISETYSTYSYQAACGTVGSLWAALMVQWNRGGRKFAMAFFTVGSGIFLFGLTAAKTSTQVKILTCFATLFQNAFYGVLYGYAPEVFPTPSRGTGDAFCAAFNRICGFFAPVIAIWSHASDTPNGPVYASAGIFVAAGIIMLGLPIETHGKTAL